MRSYKVEGLIIKRRNFGEADRLLTLFTKEKGKIKLVAKGSRKPLSKLGGMLQTFNYVSLVVAKGKNIDVITGANMVGSRETIQLGEISEIFSITEIIDRFLAENDPHPEVYDLVSETVENFDTDLVLPYFKFKLLYFTGLTPELMSCVKCDSNLDTSRNGFDLSEGVLCRDCASEGIMISNDTIKVLRLILEKDILFFKKLEIDPKVKNEIFEITDAILVGKSHFKLNGGKFINEVKELSNEASLA